MTANRPTTSRGLLFASSFYILSPWAIIGALATPALAQRPACVTDVVRLSAADTREGPTVALVLATQSHHDWRFRAIPVATGVRVSSAQINKHGTDAFIGFDADAPVRVDLTRQILELPDGDQPDKRRTAETDRIECPAFTPDQSYMDAWHQYLAAEGLTGTYRPLGDFKLTPDPRLYAPVFQFAEQEQVLPSAVDIWASDRWRALRSNGEPTDDSRRRLFREYMRGRQQEACVVYHHMSARQPEGSWVIQYWLYFPFDLGIGSHLHDSEHMFVEVDKLGGTVRRVVGAGHGSWAPNNIYHTFSLNTIPLKLPLYALVERGKHATAPDVDRDGFFTPGTDTNNDWDVTRVWGIRDNTGVTDSNIRAYQGTMMVRRRRDDAALPQLSDGAPMWRAEAEGLGKSCQLRPLPLSRPNKCDRPDANCALGHLVGHRDFVYPDDILKSDNYPPLSWRLMWSRQPTADDNPAFTKGSHRILGGFSFDLFKVGLGLPGRIAIDTIWETGKPWGLDGIDGVSGRYELLTTNLFGFYGGLSFVNDDLKDMQLMPGEFDRRYWASVGMLFEGPMWRPLRALGATSDRRLRSLLQGGLIYNNFYGLSPDIRLGFTYTFGRPYRSFGLPKSTPSPY